MLSGKGSHNRPGSSVHPDFEGKPANPATHGTVRVKVASKRAKFTFGGEAAVETPGCWKRQEHGTFAEESQVQSGASLKRSPLATIDKTAGVRAPRAP